MMNYSLNSFYRAIGVSRQAVHQRLERQKHEQAKQHQLLFLVYQLRQEHPTMGVRDMYYYLKPDSMGRDCFEQFCKANGFTSKKVKKHSRTTDSSGVVRFPNLAESLSPCRINQLWVSDITYFQLRDKFYYLTFITDAYSRRILGHSFSSRLFTEHTTLLALNMAIRTRKGMSMEGTIFHSDGGGQYYDREFVKRTADLKMRNSMCCYPWENGKAERVNGIIKNNYLIHRSITNERELKQELDRAVQLYNEKKPHSRLKRVAPVTFEAVNFEMGKHPQAQTSLQDITAMNVKQ